MDVQTIIQQLTNKLQGWLDSFVLKLPNLVAAIIVFLLFWATARALQRLINRLVPKITGSPQLTHLISQAIYITSLAAGLFIGLDILGAEKTVTSLLAGAGLIGLALGLAFQAIGENFVAGVYLAIRQPFHLGDLIKTNNQFGIVEKQALRATWLRTPDGLIIAMPNKHVFGDAIVNYSESGARRVELEVGVTYGSDLGQVADVATNAVKGIPGLLSDRPIECFYHSFGDSSINFQLRFWIRFYNQQSEYLAALSEAVIRVKRAFDRNGITIPFPIRTLDFGEVGGEKLSRTVEMLGWRKADGSKG